MTRAVWSELVPYPELRRAAVLAPLAKRGVQLIVAVLPQQVEELGGVVHAARDAGVTVGVWPMLAHADGRWPNADNVATYREHVERMLDQLDREGAQVDSLAIDLEPHIADLGRLLALDVGSIRARLSRGGMRRAQQSYDALVRSVERRGVGTLAATLPMMLFDGGGLDGWQRFFGTPCSGIAFGNVSPMLYTSMLEGYARRVLGRSDALSLLAAGAQRTRARYGERASVSLGAVSHGILGNEPTYRSVDELAEDVATARAAGVEHIIAFSLCGMLARQPVEAWLDALCYTEPATRMPQLTARARAVAVGMTAASGGMRLGARTRRLIRAWGRR